MKQHNYFQNYYTTIEICLKQDHVTLKIQLSITGINYILKYFSTEHRYFNYNISQFYSFYCICYQINSVLMSIKGITHCIDLKLLNDTVWTTFMALYDAFLFSLHKKEYRKTLFTGVGMK